MSKTFAITDIFNGLLWGVWVLITSQQDEEKLYSMQYNGSLKHFNLELYSEKKENEFPYITLDQLKHVYTYDNLYF